MRFIRSWIAVSYTHLDVYKRQVHQAAHAVKIPVMGIGGIATWQDAIEFIMAGATTLQVEAASFMNPSISMEIICLLYTSRCV